MREVKGDRFWAAHSLVRKCFTISLIHQRWICLVQNRLSQLHRVADKLRKLWIGSHPAISKSMQSSFLVGLSVCFLAAFSATADNFAFVPSSDSIGVRSKSNFDSWAPSVSNRSIYFDSGHRSVWESQQFLNYRSRDTQYGSVRTASQPDFANDPNFDPTPAFAWKALSLQNAYQIWDADEFPIAFAISVQPRVSDENVHVRETVVIGRDYDFWQWAVNFAQGNDWSNRLKERDGDLEVGFGIARALGAHWSLGVELRDHSELPEYRRLAGNKIFVGPVLRCHKDNWWMAISVLPRVLGFDYVANFDTPRDIEFDSNQKLSTRFMFGLCF
jgi:hypothetical protein